MQEKTKTVKSTGWDLYRDGVTQSMLSKFIICRHRFWIRYILGLSDMGDFNHRIEYGSMFHAGFEAFAEAKSKKLRFDAAVQAGIDGIITYCKALKSEHPTAKIAFWEKIAVAQFRMYCEHWRKEDEKRNYVFQELVFDVPTTLPSGRTIRIRGKYDEGFIERKTSRVSGKLIETETLQENKCKGDVDEEGIMGGLQLDLQTMLYLHAIDASGLMQKCRRVLYNVILRPLGGKWGGIRQRKDETEPQFIERIIDGIREKPTNNFHRFIVTLAPPDLDNFRQRTLFPMLEQLADWWDSIKDNPLDPWNTYYTVSRQKNESDIIGPNKHHYSRPFGVFDSLALGNRGDYFPFITSNGSNRVGLKFTPLFQELENPSLSQKKPKKQAK